MIPDHYTGWSEVCSRMILTGDWKDDVKCDFSITNLIFYNCIQLLCLEIENTSWKKKRNIVISSSL